MKTTIIRNGGTPREKRVVLKPSHGGVTASVLVGAALYQAMQLDGIADSYGLVVEHRGNSRLRISAKPEDMKRFRSAVYADTYNCEPSYAAAAKRALVQIDKVLESLR